MKSYCECIKEAQERGVAIGHFNISNLEALWAIFNAARGLNLPLIIGTSEGEADFVGRRQAVALVKSIREEYDYPIFLNADHHYSFEEVKKAIDAGYDSVIFDGAKLAIEENIKITKQCVEYARASGLRRAGAGFGHAKAGRDVLVEAELGYIGTSSKVLDEIPEGAAVEKQELTTVEEARRFVEETGVDLFSPAVGSIHGMLRQTKDPDLDIERIGEIAQTIKTPLVLHGGSGLTDENFTKAIKAGIRIVHINTEIRVAWRDAIKLYLQENPDEVAPYKIAKAARQAIAKVVEKKLKLFNHLA